MSEATEAVIAHGGRSFEIHLYASPGSTGYTWVLTSLPTGVGLVDVTSTPVGPQLPGSQSRQTFTFIGLGKGQGELSFKLLRLWEPDQPADARSYQVEVISEVAQVADAMQAAAGNESFLPVHFGVCEGENEGKVMIDSRMNCIHPYGFPDGTLGSVMKYGFPVNALNYVNCGGT